MGVVDSRKPPPLPAPTETESTTTPTEVATELATDVSRPADDKSSYSLPEDGTPVTIKTRHKANRSQTSLLIEYFEGGKGPSGSGSGSERKPSVRVRLTPSKHRKNDHIQITETKSARKASLTRKAVPNTPTGLRIEGEGVSVLSADGEDAHSMTSYASATEESNVSRNPIDIEIDHRRRRRPASPLIPTADSSKASYQPGTMSEISAIPTDSFLDGSGPSSRNLEKRRDKSPSRAGGLLAGAAAGLATAAVVDKMRSKSRGEEKERIVLPKTRDRDRDRDRDKDRERSDRKSKTSKSRTSSVSDKGDRGEKDDGKSSRRRSSRSHQDSMISAADSSVVSSALSPSHRSHDQYSIRSGASKSSINNPKLLETVEDAIRRLILPELDALKREQSKHRRSSAASSGTSVSREDHGHDRRRSGGSDRHAIGDRDSMGKMKETRDREARHAMAESPVHSSLSHESIDESAHERVDDTPHRSGDNIKAAVAGAALGGLAAAAMSSKSPALAREQRKRRRAEAKSRALDKYPEEYQDSDFLQTSAPMPLASEINPSEMTRTSILSAESERPHSASEELTPAPGAAPETRSVESSPTPTKNQATLQGLGAQHINVSHGDLRALPRVSTGGNVTVEEDEFETDEYGRRYPVGSRQDRDPREEYEEYDEEEQEMQQYPQYGGQPGYDYYNTQDVPPPLKYVPYQRERQGLSPIPSVSGYTEGGSEAQRDSAVLSSPGKSPHHANAPQSPGSIPSNVMSREFDQDDRSLRSSGVGADYRNTTFTDESEVDHVSSGQAVRGVGANPNFVHIPVGVESAVASLVDGSMLDGSVLTAESGGHGGGNQNQYGKGGSMVTLEEEEEAQRSHQSHDHSTPSQRSLDGLAKGAAMVSPPSPAATTSTKSGFSRDRGQPRPGTYAGEYEIDQYGRKVPASASVERRSDRNSPTASETAITGAAVAAASAALRRAAMEKGMQPRAEDEDEDYEDQQGFVGAGVQRNKSFKERTMDGRRPANTPSHSVDRLVDDYERPKMGASGLPDANDPIPELGFYDEVSNPSVVEGRLGGSHHDRDDQHDRHDGHDRDQDIWSGHRTPTQEHHEEYDYESPSMHDEPQQRSGHGFSTAAGVAAGAAAIATAAAMASSHSRQASQEQDEEWQRTSDERKRDTLVTNPFEGTSPNVNMPGLGDNLLGGTAPVYQTPTFAQDYSTRSPLGHKVDEGYISQGPNKTPDLHRGKGKGVEFSQPANLEDPFFTPKGLRHMSGMSHGMGSPLYDASTGAGIDRIESKDIVALMQHLMVRDAQRSARDTEILMTLVRSAAEMRESFEKIKVMMADSEDVIIREVEENTEKTVQKAIGGPRPFPSTATGTTNGTTTGVYAGGALPGSGARSFQGGGSQTGTEDLPTKKQNLFRRALKGLSAKGNNDLGRIEDMLMQLLTEVDVLKAQTAGAGGGVGTGAGAGAGVSPMQGAGHSFENLQPAVQYEHDRGYEPEGNAGTSTASHASQSGHLSIPGSRNLSGKLGYDRKFSDHRISTVPEANEDEYDHDMGMGMDRHDGRHDSHLDDHPDDDHQEAALSNHKQYSNSNNDSNAEMLNVPQDRSVRGSSVPLGTPPQPAVPAQGSLSNDNTPRTDKSKKHKSSGSSNWFPKISRWSETTTSSVVGKVFRGSRDSRKDADGGDFNGPSRSGSDLAGYDGYPNVDPYGDDKLHTGFSDQDLPRMPRMDADESMMPFDEALPPRLAYMTPEDPKYKAHRNSLNLQHPQPRSGQPFQQALESRVHDYDTPRSPNSGHWGGSATSLHRFHGQANNPRPQRYSDASAAGQNDPQYWSPSPAPGPAAEVTAAAGPPRPPKEPIVDPSGSGAALASSSAGAAGGRSTPPKSNRLSKLQKSSPLPYHSVESGYGTATHASYNGSPRLENRNLSGALGGAVPTRRPSGPRAMTPKSVGSADEERRRKRDTFGTVASQESETF